MSTTIRIIILGVGRSDMPTKNAFFHPADDWPVSNSRDHAGVELTEEAYRTDPQLVWHRLEWGVKSVGQPAPTHDTPASVPRDSVDSRCFPWLGLREETVLCFT